MSDVSNASRAVNAMDQEPSIARRDVLSVAGRTIRHPHEEARLAAIGELERYVRENDAPMASLARQAAMMSGTSIGLVSLMEEFDQHVIGKFGIDLNRVDRRNTICTHTILQPDVLVVEDTALDARFQNLPAVAGEPHFRFYAGAPIFDATGLPLGTVCAIDMQPRDLSSRSLYALQRIAVLAATLLETRRLFAESRDPRASSLEREEIDGKLDALLLTLVEPRSAGN